jgi:hypothetical protein
MAGASASTTMTLNVHVVTLFAASLAVYVTVVVPFGNVDPGAGPVLTHDAMPQLSVRVGTVQVTTAEQRPGAVFTEMSPGQLEITGDSVSCTLTVNEYVAVLPDVSVAV